MCDGYRADARAQWCVENCSLSLVAAQQRVMGEFPAPFRAGALRWDPDTVCDGSRAEDRAKWCVEHCNLPLEAARQRVMGEFPAQFGSSGTLWDPNVICDGSRAEDRAQWCVANCNLTLEAARQRVMGEFPAQFGGTVAGGANEVVALGGVASAATEMVPVSQADPSLLVWSDEFDYTGSPNPEKWAFDVGGHGWGNNELQHYTDRKENAWVENNTLFIRAVQESFGNNSFTSARLVTKGIADWLYGRVEVRLKFPTARGTWAAAWMLPTNFDFGDWPNSGEIDIMEHVGMDSGKVHGTVHTGSYNHMKGTQVGRVVSATPTEFHTYATEWSPEGIDFIVDGARYHRFPNDQQGKSATWPFDRRFHLILNLAVGGDWGGQSGVDKDAFAGCGQVLEVAYVRVYKLH